MPTTKNPKPARATKPRFDSKRFLAQTGVGKSNAVFAEKDVIFAQGAAASAIFYIEAGKVKLTVLAKSGKEAVIAILGPKDFFGEGCLAGQVLRMATATAMTGCSVMRLERARVVEMLHS